MKNPAPSYRGRRRHRGILRARTLPGKQPSAPAARAADRFPARFSSRFLALARHSIEEIYLPRVAACLRNLSDDSIWWRPNPDSNSVGNLVLHLAGNIRQWIGSGLGGKPDIRQRDLEFQELGPVPRRMLLARLKKEVRAAARILERLSAEDLEAAYLIQGFRVSGAQAVSHVVEHFAYHCGQIIYVTKLRMGRDLKFTQLPGARSPRERSPRLPAV